MRFWLELLWLWVGDCIFWRKNLPESSGFELSASSYTGLIFNDCLRNAFSLATFLEFSSWSLR
jgi:hypothetical protein